MAGYFHSSTSLILLVILVRFNEKISKMMEKARWTESSFRASYMCTQCVHIYFIKINSTHRDIQFEINASLKNFNMHVQYMLRKTGLSKQGYKVKT